MSERIGLGLSACLAGKRVRYDGGDRLDAFLTETWGRHVDYHLLCPETEVGLGIPREAIKLFRTPEGVSAVGAKSGIDRTAEITSWCEGKLDELSPLELPGYILKAKSPSCAGDEADDGAWAAGLFAAALAKRHPLVPVIDDKGIRNPDLRDLFVTRLFVLRDWRGVKAGGATRAGLATFHVANKLLFLAHSPARYRELGRIAANPDTTGPEERFAAYEAALLELLRHPATTGRHANVLSHIAGYFRKNLDGGDRKELAEAIEDYRKGLLSIAVPIALANHHSRKSPNPFLEAQTYLHPHPFEIRLRG